MISSLLCLFLVTIPPGELSFVYPYVLLISSSCLAQNVFPTSGTLLENFEGTFNATILNCDVFDRSFQVSTQWSLQNFRGISELQLITNC